MDDATYKKWWQLHLRVARGEVLDATDRGFHDEYSKQLDREEAIRLPALDELRHRIGLLEAENQELQKQRQVLEARIRGLELSFSKP